MEGMYEMSYVTVQAESISCPSDGDIAILAQTSGGYSSVLLQRVVWNSVLGGRFRLLKQGYAHAPIEHHGKFILGKKFRVADNWRLFLGVWSHLGQTCLRRTAWIWEQSFSTYVHKRTRAQGQTHTLPTPESEGIIAGLSLRHAAKLLLLYFGLSVAHTFGGLINVSFKSMKHGELCPDEPLVPSSPTG